MYIYIACIYIICRYVCKYMRYCVTTLRQAHAPANLISPLPDPDVVPKAAAEVCVCVCLCVSARARVRVCMRGCSCSGVRGCAYVSEGVCV